MEYIRRLRVDAERTWPFVARALATVGLIRQTAAVAAAFWEEASESRPACHRHAAEGRWAILEPKLAAELRRGLPLKLAAARVGVPYASVRNRCAADPDMGSRLEIARLQGVAKIHGYVVERAATSDNAAKSLLEWSGEPEYTPRLKIQEPDEGEIVRSRAWARLTSRLAGVLCAECRARAAEAVGDG